MTFAFEENTRPPRKPPNKASRNFPNWVCVNCKQGFAKDTPITRCTSCEKGYLVRWLCFERKRA